MKGKLFWAVSFPFLQKNYMKSPHNAASPLTKLIEVMKKYFQFGSMSGLNVAYDLQF
jgi:hypothetical protein